MYCGIAPEEQKKENQLTASGNIGISALFQRIILIHSKKVVFGVNRGSCLKGCGCLKYEQEQGHEGGPCLNCGHYPTKHEDLGAFHLQLQMAERFGNSYKNWLIHHKDIEYEFKIGDGTVNNLHNYVGNCLMLFY